MGFLVTNSDGEQEEFKVAHRSNGIRWLTPLAELLDNDTPVIPIDNSAQGIYTIGDIKSAMSNAENKWKTNKVLRVGDLIDILRKFDERLPVIVNRDAKDHDYFIRANMIRIATEPYFANDNDDVMENEPKFLNIATI